MKTCRFPFAFPFFLAVLVFLNGLNVSVEAQSKTNASILPPGYPDRSATLDVLPGFKTPPPGYGEVSFYWWLGDTLTRERITWQLDQLAGKSITGLQVNYAHSDEGGNIWGLTYPGKPRLFSKEWWDLFSWFLQEAKKRNMSVSLSDYTLGIAGQGWFVDEMLAENKSLCGSRLLSKEFMLRANQDTLINLPDNLLSLVICQMANGQMVPGSLVNLSGSMEKVYHPEPENEVRKILFVYYETVKTSFDPMNPLSGKKVIEKFFKPFEEHCPGEAGKGLNFFFSDELNFGITGLLWNPDFAKEFKKRKGYDLLPEISALFMDIGPGTPKIRIDFNDVMVTLSEENFFRPIYNWHTDRGMLYGCDHGGRGLDVTEFGDYFRAQRWMSGPGCDQPVLGRNISKNKVASSIAHLYERPRTWLEGYHSSGWGTSSAQIADATFVNFAMGQNLLSLHGLYYSTHGGWWEWAPPDNHFRQPYWDGMGDLLKCTERLSYVLSQGYHRCDVAIVYPVTPVVTGMDGQLAVSTAFAAGEKLYKAGIDYDFIDFESLARARVKDGELQVSGESYKVLILPAMSAVRFSTMEKTFDFFQGGGIVIALGALPEASERTGRDDASLQSMNSKIFGVSANEIRPGGGNLLTRSTPKNGYGIFLEKLDSIAEEISGLITTDFRVFGQCESPYILHRKVGKRDIYFVYGVPKDTVCYFRSTGAVELWNPWNGTVKTLPVLYSGNTGTRIRMPLSAMEPQLIVFSPGEAVTDADSEPVKAKGEVLLVGDWEFELKPTLDNRWGDYRQPPYAGFVATDANVIRYKPEGENADQWQNPGFDDSGWDMVQISYGPQFWRLGPLPVSADSIALEKLLSSLKRVDPAIPVKVGNKNYYWSPYEFSWRWGLKGNPGRQGYHGLKEWIHDDIFQFGRDVRDWPGVPRPRILPDPAGTTYYVWSTVGSVEEQVAKPLAGGNLPAAMWLNNNLIIISGQEIGLKAGANPLLLKYTSTGTGYVVFERPTLSVGPRPQVPLSTNWYLNPDLLTYDLLPGMGNSAGWYRFKSPPGLQSIEMAMNQRPQVWVNGREVPVRSFKAPAGLYADSLQVAWKAEPATSVSASAQVAIRCRMEPGFYGGAAIPEPIRLNCGRGLLRPGDLSEDESLRTYSGGMTYRKTILLSAEQIRSRRILLDLGYLVSTAEVWVNGTLVGKRLSPPWQFEVANLLRVGENRLEVLIYNTLGNYYLTTPSNYVGSTQSGLIGPVKLILE